MSEAHKGKVPWNKGIPLSEESKRKMSERVKERCKSVEYRAMMSEARRGIPHTEETKHRLSEIMQGRVVSVETRRRMSEANQRRVLSDWYEDYIKRLRIIGKNRVLTEDVKEKIRVARAGQIMPYRDTKPERKVQNALRRMYIDYRKHKILFGLLPQPYKYHRFDIIVDARKLIIEIQGCYWHGCPICYSNPSELQKNTSDKDQKIRALAEAGGWKVVWLWEHDININNFENKILEVMK